MKPPTQGPTRIIGSPTAHISYLDGLRGVAASWVLLSHVSLLVSFHIPIVSDGQLAVDLFMVLSGFLMTFHYFDRQHAEPWRKPRTWIRFWLKRYFRIAPLFYLLLAVALELAPFLAASRSSIASVYPETATNTARYLDVSLTNITLHLSFLFGAVPGYSFRTPLPDWSIGLEMQFYLLFPFIMLAWQYVGRIAATAIFVFVCTFINLNFHYYVSLFPMPSILPLKLHIFVAGMLLAGSRFSVGRERYQALSLATLLPLSASLLGVDSFRGAIFQTLLLIGLVILMGNNDEVGPKILRAMSRTLARLLDCTLLRWLGEISYSVYLAHLLLLVPIASWLAENPRFRDLTGLERFVVCLSLCIPPVHLASAAMYHGIEKQGIKLGRIVISRLTTKN